MESWIKQLLPIIEEYKDGDPEPLDGDEVDRIGEIIKAKINLHEGNITEEEYDAILDKGKSSPKETIVKVKDIESGEIQDWTIDAILEEINRDRSGGWTPYDKTDWVEGWREWVEGEFYSIVDIEPSEEVKKNAWNYLVADDEAELKQMILQIIKAEDLTSLIDNVDDVVVWQKVEFEFTCEEFISIIEL